MKTYKITYDFEQFYSFTIKGVELYSKMPEYTPRFNATSRLRDWVTPDASFYATSNYINSKVAIPHITTWVTGNIVLNAEAYKCLAEKLKPSGEFLPVSVEGIDYYIFNTLKIIDESFIGKSNAIKVVDGGVDVGFDNIAFSTDGLDEAMLFKTSTDQKLHTYCTQEFKDLVENKNLFGLLFEEVRVS